MKFLVVTESYPRKAGDYLQAYVRERNLFYLQSGISVDVLNFSCSDNYVLDEINIYSYQWIKKNVSILKEYDLLICHAPNIKHHYLFLRKYGDLIKKKVYFFHGHEVLKENKVYPKPYSYMAKNYIRNFLQDIYDELKFKVWKKFFQNQYLNSYFIFVSNWMMKQFEYWVKLDYKYWKEHSNIIYNSVGEDFEKNSYDLTVLKEYDFITIRGNLDLSKYSVDIVNNLAKLNPDMKFLLIGKGQFFDYFEKAENLTWINRHLNHIEMLEALNSAKCALMPTRCDAQGVMMCEMVTFGIPLITSDISVCKEVFEGFENVRYINNDNLSVDLKDMLKSFTNRVSDKPEKYLYSTVCNKELNVLKSIIRE